jgi:hypothetical protein
MAVFEISFLQGVIPKPRVFTSKARNLSRRGQSSYARPFAD